MNNQSSLRGAIGSVFGTVSSIASTVGNLFDTGNDSVKMLNTYVSTAAEKQRISTDYDLATYEQRVLNTVAMEETKQNHEIKAFMRENPENEKLFQTSYERIREAVALRRNPNAETTSA